MAGCVIATGELCDQCRDNSRLVLVPVLGNDNAGHISSSA